MPKQYKMTEAQLKKILDACKPVPYMVFGGQPPTSPQENANRAWQELAKELGFKWDTVRPCGDDNKVFEAEPIEEKLT